MNLALPAWIPPSQFEEYRLLRPLGKGGMGQVFLAHDQLLDRTVAIKFIGAFEPDAEARARFLVEGRAAGRLSHPNVVAVYRVGEIDGRPYIVSEYVRGQSLAALDLPLAPQRVLEMGIQLARGLASAHRQGVFHRDIKPGNAVIGEDGVVKLLDFGLAKLLATGGGAVDDPRRLSGSVSFRLIRPPPAAEGDATARVPLVDKATGPATGPTALRPARISAVMGTPHYMAPEVWRNSPSTPRADVYALGAVLYELSSGATPHGHHGELTLVELGSVVQDEAAPALAEVVPDLDPRFAAVIDRCLRRAPEERYASGEELREALEQLAIAPTQRAALDVEPYPGLATFEADHRAVFFGRGSDTRAIVERLRATGLVLVAGDSGVGKSSICRAGVLPLIAEGAIEERRVWQTVTVAVGKHPVAGLAAAVAFLLGRDEDAVAALIRTEPRTLVREFRAALRDARGVLLFFDQLEELVTLSLPREAVAIAELLRELGPGIPGLRALATVRGDFLTRVAALPGLAEGAARSLYLLGPLPPAAVCQAIEGPALARGVQFESPALVTQLAEATAANAGGLPLLQFALAELWQARDHGRRLITHAALTRIGGVAGALARHADLVIAGLVPTLRPAARRVLMQLVTPEGTRARVYEDDLVDGDRDVAAALAALVRGRLVLGRDAIGGERDAGSTYELAHEALLTGWDTLRRWLGETAGSRAFLRRLGLAAVEWERLGRASDALWGNRQLIEVAAVDARELEPRERSFLERSRRRAHLLRVLRWAVLCAGPILAIGLWGSVEVVSQQRRSTAAAATAQELRIKVDARLDEAQRLVGQARGHDAEATRLREAALAAFDGRRGGEGEALWSRARAAAAATDRGWNQAEQALEQANYLDSKRPEVKRQLADLLAARAEAASRERRPADLENLLARLATFDAGGARLARFTAPATLVVAVEPANATVELERYVRSGEHLELRPVQPLVLGGPQTLAGGSYLATVAATGRASARVPLLLLAGETLEMRLTLPQAGSVPPDFVYVAPGRFLRGSDDDDSLRTRFFRAPPLHEAATGGFFIARHETTYREWIAFLEALPARERAVRTPRVQVSAGSRGGLLLERLADGIWRLSIASTDRRNVARAGAPLRYQGRAHGVSQDWLRAPVAGISYDDARAYLRWLDQTQRVPRARLCSEIEWERAARGADGRAYPSGDGLAAGDANFDATYGRLPHALGPDEVGSHPSGVSPFGVYDMAGNVWELTTSSEAEGEIVAKGGSFYSDALSSHAANRELPDATLRDTTVGLRVCAD